MLGVTSRIEVRVRQHKEGLFEGYSKRYNCNRLVWVERHSYIQDAIAREKQLKGWSRAKKIALVERENPAWMDLSEAWGFADEDVRRAVSGDSPCNRGVRAATAGPSTAPLAIKLREASLRMILLLSIRCLPEAICPCAL